MTLEPGDQFRAGGDVVQFEHALESSRLVERLPAQGQRLALVGAERVVDQRSVVGDPHVEHLGSVTALDRDLLANDLKWAPLVFEQVAIALDPLDEEVLRRRPSRW